MGIFSVTTWRCFRFLTAESGIFCFSMHRWLKSWQHSCCNFVCVCVYSQKAVRDREFEALQGKVQRLEKLRRALKVERNELNKKVQSLSGGTEGAPTSNPGTDSPSPPPTDSLLEPGTCPAPDTTTASTSSCSHSCPCEPQLDTDTLLEEANTQPVQAQEWSSTAHTFFKPPTDKPPACNPLLLCWMEPMLNTGTEANCKVTPLCTRPEYQISVWQKGLVVISQNLLQNSLLV